MDLHKLKAFIVVAEELNFRKSAEILGMSGPPLTRLISSLEKELGTKLFERTTRSVYLTGAGVLLLKEAREIAAAFSRIETEVRAVGKMKSGMIKIGFSKTTFVTRFPSIVEEFRNRFPKIRLDLLEESNHEVITLLKKGRLDVAFSEIVPQNDILKSHKIASESVGVLLPHKHRLAKRKEVHFRELMNETVIVHSRREANEFFDKTSHLIDGVSQKPQIYVKNQNESCPILVATGKGISFQVNGAWSAIPEHLRLVRVSDMTVPIFMLWRPDDCASQIKSFLSLVIERQNVLPQRSECLVISNELVG
jgi:DNA-binding transcriptional LysR family regulator